MLINEKTAVSSSKDLLVPYSRHHVPRYHEWMKDPEIQEATASEPLSLDEEYAMQASWRNDADKLTFIICSPLPTTTEVQPETAISDPRFDAPEMMVGDVNLFLRLEEDGDDDDDDSDNESETSGRGSSAGTPHVVGEVELMVAEKTNQRKGFGRAALICFLKYILDHEDEIVAEFLKGTRGYYYHGSEDTPPTTTTCQPKLSYLVVKIGQSNTRSLALFESLAFKRVTEKPNIFGELELRRFGLGADDVKDLLDRYDIRGYRELIYER
ncbi:hypothetical protein AJ80_04571 [Polytolypa hystricis UAMH7299]|uniref:N-acetyltransferase domain-containing protein n=1 Tax=Polytolypa hystricis (strain UAMH7299) TaxID=1447883 RepID=A0A2B7Y277_POLH7|nr:hypothetical protein AJ80_04571 [Polytolypa hystricis UAMH7299]